MMIYDQWPDRYRDPYYQNPFPPHSPLPNYAEQLGIDPTSKLAAAIDRLAAAFEVFNAKEK